MVRVKQDVVDSHAGELTGTKNSEYQKAFRAQQPSVVGSIGSAKVDPHNQETAISQTWRSLETKERGIDKIRARLATLES